VSKSLELHQYFVENSFEYDEAVQLTLAEGLFDIAESIHALGVNHAITSEGGSMGAIEALAKEVKDGLLLLASVIEK
jgi:hypothetical protein